MTKIPPPPPRKKTADLKPVITEWLEAKTQLAAFQAREMELRLFLVAQLFPAKKEGSNRLVKPGFEAVCSCKIYRKVDVAAFSTMKEELRKKGLNLDVLLEMEPKLVLKEYRALDERKRRLFENILTITDGSPALEINLGT